VVDLDVGLPAGVEVDRAAMPGGNWRAGDGEVAFEGLVLQNGTWSTRIPVLPTVAGELRAGPTTVRIGGTSFTRAPRVWEVR
jgi:hypothetical protein